MLSSGCHAVCRIFLLKSKHSKVISSFFRLPEVATFFNSSACLGFAPSREASKHKSSFVSQLKMWKKLLYDPVMIDLERKVCVEWYTPFAFAHSTVIQNFHWLLTYRLHSRNIQIYQKYSHFHTMNTIWSWGNHERWTLQLVSSPCWGPRLWQWGNLLSTCICHCDKTSHLILTIWFQRKTIC